MFFLFPTLFIILYNKIKTSNIVIIPLKEEYNVLNVEMTIGTPPQIFKHSIEQYLTTIWTSENFYNIHQSTSFKIIKENQKMNFQMYTIFGQLVEETFAFTTVELNNTENKGKTIILNNIPFVNTFNIRGFNSRVGGIGLAYKFHDIKYSFIHILYERKYIDYLSYSFIPSRFIDYSSPLLLLGKLPNDLTKNLNKVICKVNKKYYGWSCILNSLKINNHYYENNYYAYFQYSDHRILAPDDYMDFLNKYIFKEYIDKNICFYELYGMNHRFNCQCKIRETFPNIIFIFDGNKLELGGKELFFEEDNNCLFIIWDNHIRRNNWVFGHSFMNKFLMEFDYNSNEIYFYSKKKI